MGRYFRFQNLVDVCVVVFVRLVISPPALPGQAMAAGKLLDISRPTLYPFTAKPRVNANETPTWACLMGHDQVVVYEI